MPSDLEIEPNAIECRCATTTSIEGIEAKQYADGHLVVHWRRDSGEWFRAKSKGAGSAWWSRQVDEWTGTGFGECQCPATGWRFEESWQREPESHSLRRRPWTRPEDYLDAEIVRARADEVRRTDDLVQRSFARRDSDPVAWGAWRDATEAARTARDALYSPDLDELHAGIRRHDPVAINSAIVFLEVDPWVFRSGYRKDSLLKLLSRAPLDPTQQQRVRTLLLAALTRGPRREFSAMLRLAHHVRSPAFADAVRPLTLTGPDGRRRAAGRMLAAIEGSRRSGHKGSRSRQRG